MGFFKQNSQKKMKIFKKIMLYIIILYVIGVLNDVLTDIQFQNFNREMIEEELK